MCLKFQYIHDLEIWEWLPIILSIFSLLIAGPTLLNTIRNHRKNAKWEEYSETVYNPIMEELGCLDQKIKLCRRIETNVSDEKEAKSFVYDLSEMLNDLELVCDKADNHNSKILKNWYEFTETETKKIHDFIANQSTTVSDTVIPEGLTKVLQECRQNYDKRLRDQRIRMTGGM